MAESQDILYQQMLEAQEKMAEENQTGRTSTPFYMSVSTTPPRSERNSPKPEESSTTPVQPGNRSVVNVSPGRQDGNRSLSNHDSFQPVLPRPEPRPVTLVPNSTSLPYAQFNNENPPSRNEDTFRLKMKPREFNGTTPWEEYWLHFRQVALLNHWATEDSRQFLLANLGGLALEFVFTLPEITRDSFTELTESLGKRFGAAREATIHQAALEGTYRRPGQTIPALGQEIRKKVRLAYPTVDMEAQEALAISHFRRAITDATQRMFICNSEPKSLDKAMEAALRAEAYEAIEEGRDRPRRIRNITPSTEQQEIDELRAKIANLEKTQEEQNRRPWNRPYEQPRVRQLLNSPANSQEQLRKEKEKIICYRCNRPGHRTIECKTRLPPTSSGPLTCYNCGRQGHLARSCRQNTTTSGRERDCEHRVGIITSTPLSNM